MGNATWTEKKIGSMGNLRCKIGDLTLSSSYALGGDAAPPSLFGMNEVLWAEFDTLPSGVKLDYIKVSPQSGPTTANTVKVWFPTGGSGTSPTTLINAAIQWPTGGSAVVAGSTSPIVTLVPGVAVEAGSGASLTTITARMIAFGY